MSNVMIQNKTEEKVIKNLEYLNQFKGYRVEIFINPSDLRFNSTYHYENFSWEVDYENNLVLMDEYDPDARTYININQINNVTNLTDNIKTTVVDLITEHFIVSICISE